MTDVTNWYKNKNIFVTGATGFVGKCLVEKLLRDCPEIGDVYLVIRDTEKNKFDERKKSFANHVVFSKLAAERPNDLEKIKIIKGDIDQVNLGVSNEEYREICERVSVIFHSAADVRFDRTITDAYRANVIGTKNVLDFALRIKNLEVFILYLSKKRKISGVNTIFNSHKIYFRYLFTSQLHIHKRTIRS
jgi:fatty acyl-CoA reductase